MGNKLHLLYAGLALIAVIMAGIFWYLRANNQPEINEEAEVPAETVKIETETNPVKSIPDLNPADKTNPFKTRNPFE